MPLGIVVENLVSGNRHALSAANFNPKREKKVRDLRPGETVLGFRAKAKRVAPRQDDPVLFELPKTTAPKKEG